MRMVSPSHTGIKVHSINKIREGVTLDVDKEEDLNVIKSTVVNNLRVRAPKGKLPTLMIYDIPNSVKNRRSWSRSKPKISRVCWKMNLNPASNYF